ncbi:MAG TPA: (2Fe-2S)-binding protein [Natronosporangium sp.]|jgi:predicted molibdopterin-dependent oxidoreductase YjgC|nr:(2Fe-2S)-binding protein [Natronosporangium sp.]
MTVTIQIDGRPVQVPEGITVAAALVSTGQWAFRRHAVSNQPRGPFCGMGVCFECELTVDGRPEVRACLTVVREGIQIQTTPRASATGPDTPGGGHD